MIALVDPGSTSTNLGDQIISAAVRKHFVDPLEAGGVEVASVPLHGPVENAHRRALRAASDVVVSGTNLLSDHMYLRSPWVWKREDIGLAADKLTVFGAGWWQYQVGGIDLLTRRWFRRLSGGKSWSVRDTYSRDRLQKAGIRTLHTSCPTLWGVHRQRMPGQARRVVTTMTDYAQDPIADSALLRLLRERFDEVRFWPQGPGDAAYAAGLGICRAAIIRRTVDAFDDELRQPGTGYVGLRLHAGIRAAAHDAPSLILSVDNRSREIARSVGLVCPSRYAVHEIASLLASDRVFDLDLPMADIRTWLGQWAVR